MKKIAKLALIILILVLILFLGVVVYYLSSTFKYNLDENKLINTQNSIEFYDSNGDKISCFSNNTQIVKLFELILSYSPENCI